MKLPIRLFAMKILHLGGRKYYLQIELRFQTRARDFITDYIYTLIGHLLDRDTNQCRAEPFQEEATTIALTRHSSSLSPERRSSLLPPSIIGGRQDDMSSIGKVTAEFNSVKTSVTDAISGMTDTLQQNRANDIRPLEIMLLSLIHI